MDKSRRDSWFLVGGAVVTLAVGEHPKRARVATESRDHSVDLFTGAGVCALFAIGLGVAAVFIGRRKV